MNGIHDIGGMHGFGQVLEVNEPVFHRSWEGRVFAMASLAIAAGVANSDSFRHAIERLLAVAYLTLGYYGRRLAALENLLIDAGWVSPDEVEAHLNGREIAAASPATASRSIQAGALRRICHAHPNRGRWYREAPMRDALAQ